MNDRFDFNIIKLCYTCASSCGFLYGKLKLELRDDGSRGPCPFIRYEIL